MLLSLLAPSTVPGSFAVLFGGGVLFYLLTSGTSYLYYFVLLIFLLPLHVSVYAFFLMFLQVWSTLIHERVTWVRWGAINYTAHHTLHHKLNKTNYGQFFTACDRLFGSYKSPEGLVYDGADPRLTRPSDGRKAHGNHLSA